MFLKLSGFKFNLQKTTLFDRDQLFKGGSLLAQFQYQFARYRTSLALNILVHSVYNFIHDLALQKRSARSQKFKFVKLWAWLAYSERTTWKKPPCQQSACWCKLVRRYDTSTSLLWWLHTNPSNIGLDCIVNHPGLIWSYWNITVLLPPHQFAPTG